MSHQKNRIYLSLPIRRGWLDITDYLRKAGIEENLTSPELQQVQQEVEQAIKDALRPKRLLQARENAAEAVLQILRQKRKAWAEESAGMSGEGQAQASTV